MKKKCLGQKTTVRQRGSIIGGFCHSTLGFSTRYSTPGTRFSTGYSTLATLLPGGADCVLGDQGIGCQERQFMLDGLAN